MPVRLLPMILLVLSLLALPLPAKAQLRWVEGVHYVKLPTPGTAESRPGKIEVAEVFSYGCIHCFRAKEDIAKLQAALPPDAYMTYVHASFIPSEAWPMYQRAWYTAQQIGVGLRAGPGAGADMHSKMFSAVWETGEVALLDKAGSVRKPLPTIQEAARFYARAAGVKESEFLKVASSPAIDAKMKSADALIKSWRVPGTPALVVNGRYLVQNDSVSKWDDVRAIVLSLVSQERIRMSRQQGTGDAR